MNNKDIKQFFNDHWRTSTYQYLCSECYQITEKSFPVGQSDPVVQCENPTCHGRAHRVLTTPNVLGGIPVNSTEGEIKNEDRHSSNRGGDTKH